MKPSPRSPPGRVAVGKPGVREVVAVEALDDGEPGAAQEPVVLRAFPVRQFRVEQAVDGVDLAGRGPAGELVDARPGDEQLAGLLVEPLRPSSCPSPASLHAGAVRAAARVTVERETSAPCSSPDRSQILVAVCRCLRQFARSSASHCCDRGQIRVRPPTRAAFSPTARPTDPPSRGTYAPSAPPACVFRAIDATDSPFRRKRRIDCTWGMPVIILPGPFWWRYKHHPVKTITWSACSA
ncbi:hypothetical protein CQR47_0316 [Bifidobacterium thermophilum]|uniref:Uncharacterized protein n=1 Tax=Bifidobacterium thermophilum TaxID=33905 RepID=A0A2N3QPE2_9BIFI|nr:hypothetical protein CQR47_0316 [Bifidobacterium thermophilum]